MTKATLRERIESGEISMKVVSFWRDLMGAIFKDPERLYTSGIMPTAMIADYMGMSTKETEKFMIMCNEAGLTDRQGGGWTV